jgi:hypothetical protein
MKGLAVAIADAAIVAVALVALAPASLADRRVAEASFGRLRIAEASGTLLHGRGWLTDARGASRVPVQWRLDALALARGVVDATLSSDVASPAPGGRIVVDGPRFSAHGLTVALPAGALAALVAVDGAQAGGDVTFRADSLASEGGRVTGSIEGRWVRARAVVMPGVAIDLGTVSVKLAPTADGLAGPIEARGGTLLASGTAVLGAESARLDVELQPSADAPDALRHALAIVGRPDARGVVRLSLSRPL